MSAPEERTPPIDQAKAQEQREDALRFGPLGPECVHLCVDMQRIFAEDTPWNVPWMMRVLPRIEALVARFPERTVFTRFLPVNTSDDAVGAWRRYWRRWSEMTLDKIEPEMTDLIPELARFVPPAAIVDKHVYSPWVSADLAALLAQRRATTILISGGETDLCVLASVLGAVDYGYRVVLATDALCSSSDETHEALMKLYVSRFSQQVETVSVETALRSWA